MNGNSAITLRVKFQKPLIGEISLLASENEEQLRNALELAQLHHEMREVWTDGPKLPKLDDELKAEVERLFGGSPGRGHCDWRSTIARGRQHAGAPDDGRIRNITASHSSDVKRFLLGRDDGIGK